MPEHVPMMKLWSLNPETGLWEEESDFKPESQGGTEGKTGPSWWATWRSVSGGFLTWIGKQEVLHQGEGLQE